MKQLTLLLLGLLILFSFSLFAQEKEQPLYILQNQEMIETGRKHIKELLDNREHIIGIEYIVATSSSRQFYSRWGHALLRFISDNEAFLNQKVLGFVAIVDEEKLSIKKGLFGGYQTFANVNTLGYFWNQYVRSENRPLERYIIPTNKEMRDRLLDTLQQWTDSPDKLSDYTFLNKNCAGTLTDFLIASNFPNSFKGLSGRIPNKLNKWLKRNMLSLHPQLLVHSPLVVYQKTAKALEVPLAEIRRTKKWPADASKRLINNLEPRELLYLYHEIWNMPSQVAEAISSQYNYRQDKYQFTDVIGFHPLPLSFYELCDSLECAENQLRIERETWGDEAKEVAQKDRFQIFMDNYYFEDPLHGSEEVYELWPLRKSLKENPALVNHFLLLLEADNRCPKKYWFTDINRCL